MSETSVPFKNLTKILIIGSGGREHALVRACLESPLAQSGALEVIAAPGNGGMAAEVTCFPELNAEDVDAIVALATAQGAGFVIVGPEAPLAAGAVDALRAVGIPAFGPHKAAAALEASKAFCKNFLETNNIPTAKTVVVESLPQALEALEAREQRADLAGRTYPLVIKADGLAAGKGVFIVNSKHEAQSVLTDLLEANLLGSSGNRALLEDYLEGEEVSVMLLVNDTHYAVLPYSQDHKRALDNDAGPNTGGMGAYAPAPCVTPALEESIHANIIQPTLQGINAAGIGYQGVLYIGLMLTPSGPQVLEFNVRFGDPETQVLLPLVKGDVAQLLYTCATGALETGSVELKDAAALVVVKSAAGYPGPYTKGAPIALPENTESTWVVHAGTAKTEAGQLVSSGGRVLGIVATGASIQAAQQAAYAAAKQPMFEGEHFRSDIGARALK